MLEYLIEGAPEGNRADPAVLDKHGTANKCVCECERVCECEYGCGCMRVNLFFMYIMHASMVCMCVFGIFM